MISDRRRAIIAVCVAALAATGTGLAIGLFEDDGANPEAIEAPAPNTETAQDRAQTPDRDRPDEPERGAEALPPTEDDPQGLAPGPSGPPPSGADETAAAEAARAYVRALDGRDGARVCDAFAPGALDRLDFPRRRGSCASTVEASLAFDIGGGQPVWRASQMTDAVSAQVDGDLAKVVATVFTRYADIREPTIEDDLIYLARSGPGDGWLVAQPSATAYRAIGIADVPIAALKPPR